MLQAKRSIAQPYQPRFEQRHLVAVAVVLPDAVRLVVRSVFPLVWVVAEPVLSPLPFVNVVLSTLEPLAWVVLVLTWVPHLRDPASANDSVTGRNPCLPALLALGSIGLGRVQPSATPS